MWTKEWGGPKCAHAWWLERKTEGRTEVDGVWFMRPTPSLVARLMTHLWCEGSDVPEIERYPNDRTDDILRVVQLGQGMEG